MGLKQEELMELTDFCRIMRIDILKMINCAKSGHTGGSLSCVEIFSVLFKKVLNHCPDWDKSCNFDKRDRFILSKGHASPALYAILANCGYFDKSELSTFRRFNSRLQGHPCSKYLPGIEVSTGSLGQGLSIGGGMAMGLKLDKNNTSKVFVYLGDGEMQEGSVWEAVMSISHYKLDNLVAIVDRNKLQIDGCTEDVMSLGDVKKKFDVFGWNTIEIDGHDLVQIYQALLMAKENKGKPFAIIANTVKGKGISFIENQAGWHGKAPSDDELKRALEELC